MTELARLVEALDRLSHQKTAWRVAIDGLGGSGKTTLAEFLKDRLAGAVVLQLDDFYSQALQAADLAHLEAQVLLPLSRRQAARYQVYEWKTGRMSDWQTLQPEGIVFFEGVYALDRSIRDYFDLKVWVDCPPDLGLRRGVSLDLARDGQDNTDKWRDVWAPLEARYRRKQAPQRCADFVIDGTIPYR